MSSSYLGWIKTLTFNETQTYLDVVLFPHLRKGVTA